jgi:hypothetical protein
VPLGVFLHRAVKPGVEKLTARQREVLQPVRPGRLQHRANACSCSIRMSDCCRLISSWMRPSARPFAAGTKNRIEFYSEFLDVAGFPGEEQRQLDFLRDKYRERPPDLVIAVSGGALVFLAEHRAELFAGVPIVYCSVAGDPHLDHVSDAKIAEVRVPDGVSSTLEMMLQLHPDTRQVAVVSGSGPRDRQFADVYRQKMTSFGNRVAFTWLTNLSMEELRGELSRLPDHTVVLYLSMFQDAASKTFTPRQALDAFARRAAHLRESQQRSQRQEAPRGAAMEKPALPTGAGRAQCDRVPGLHFKRGL